MVQESTLMSWLSARKYKNALKANNLIHDALVMGVSDKYIEQDHLEKNEYNLLLLGRSLNWLIPRQDYDFDNDIEQIENITFKNQLRKDEDKIYTKGLEIINSDPILEKVVAHYVSYHLFLLEKLFPKNAEVKFPGSVRMKKTLFQSTEKEPDVQSPNFKENYKNLFVEFNQEYGKYGKVLKDKTIDDLFSYI